jgi:hypothetical protein
MNIAGARLFGPKGAGNAGQGGAKEERQGQFGPARKDRNPR